MQWSTCLSGTAPAYSSLLRAASIVILYAGLSFNVPAQSGGSSTSVSGTVMDPTGAVVFDAKVEIRNLVSGFSRSTSTNNSGVFTFPNVPFNPYHLTVTALGFAPYAEDVEARSAVPIDLKISLALSGASTRSPLRREIYWRTHPSFTAT